MNVYCRPKYHPQEFTLVIITAVNIPPEANANSALGDLYNTVSSQQSVCPEAVHIIAEDFNYASLKTVLPKFHQHIKCATR